MAYSKRSCPNAEELLQLIAYAYYNQGAQIQYDQKSGRRMLDVTPEQATAENSVYLDCSSFVNSIYKYAFGVTVIPTGTYSTTNTKGFMTFAKNNFGTNSEVINYAETKDFTTQASKDAKLSELRSQLKIGDLIVYRYDDDSAGHVLIYMGNDVFLHATGASYDYENGLEKTEANGAVQELLSTNLFSNKSSSRYLFGSKVDMFCVLRPLNRTGLTVMPAAKSRLKLDGLDIEKYSNVNNFSSVSLGETIKYYIVLKNNSNAPIVGFNVTEVISNYVTLETMSHNGIYVDGTLLFSVARLEAGQTLKLSFTVNVKNNSDLVGMALESSQTSVETVITNPLYFTIIDMNESQLNQLSNVIGSVVGSTSYSSSLSLIQSVYQTFSDNIMMDNPIQSYITLTQLYNESMLGAIYMYGGTSYDTYSINNQDMRVRIIKSQYLCPGDILMLYNGSTFIIYMFDGSGLISIDFNSSTVTKYTIIDDILISANAFVSFKIIRPLLVMGA